MDQESFRNLLSNPKAASSSTAHVRGSLLTAATAGAGAKGKKTKTVDASQPAFKPRQVKKGAKGESYRDRATERRLGTANDYAQVEALADEFEKRNADNEDRDAVEEQRKHLGGDSAHTVLVKGLDFALLEQARARAAAESAATDDVSLEAAYRAAPPPVRRTRAEILRDLKSKRAPGEGAVMDAVDADKAKAQAEEDARALEAAKKAGKFRPIGFKPVGGGAPEKGEKAKRKKKVKAGEPEENGERRKKRKVVSTAVGIVQESPPREDGADEAGPSTSAPATTEAPAKPAPAPEPEPVDEDFDIFADAGEYTGVDLGDDSDSDGGAGAGAAGAPPEEGEVPEARPRKWLTTSDDERELAAPRVSPPPTRSNGSPSGSASPGRRAGGRGKSPAVAVEDGEMDEEDEERPMRLQPLASSALPSIKDLLAMNDETEKAEKRRARKEKKKAGGGGGGGGAKDGGGGGEKEKESNLKAKVERDYQRLKAYTDKKAKA
ncbi:RED-like protein N-terminal region-domain-containing protein [Lenzites betulinus]|nr:RED-like protein N-terminal region-domain-containing protein [Lenzites betulinus]